MTTRRQRLANLLLVTLSTVSALGLAEVLFRWYASHTYDPDLPEWAVNLVVVRGPQVFAFKPHATGKWLADLFFLARQCLRRAGVSDVHGGTLCTYSDARRFYSYRRERTTGRMAAPGESGNSQDRKPG